MVGWKWGFQVTVGRTSDRRDVSTASIIGEVVGFMILKVHDISRFFFSFFFSFPVTSSTGVVLGYLQLYFAVFAVASWVIILLFATFTVLPWGKEVEIEKF